MSTSQTNPQPTEQLWDAQDVANYIKASRSFVYKAVENGSLPCLRIGSMVRFKPDVVRAFAEGALVSR